MGRRGLFRCAGRSSNRARSRWCGGSGPSSKSRRRSRVSRPPNCNASSGSAATRRHGPGSTRIPHRHRSPNREPPVRRGRGIDDVGGPEPGKPGRAAEVEAIVAAAVEKRGQGCGRVRLGVIANVSANVLTAFVDSHLGDGETAHTDGWRGYAQLGKTGYRHIISVLFQARSDRGRGTAPRSSDLLSASSDRSPAPHEGGWSLKHLDGYLPEPFRFNRTRPPDLQARRTSPSP